MGSDVPQSESAHGEPRPPDGGVYSRTTTLTASTASPPVSLGPFRIRRLLHSGEGWAVYEAQQEQPRRPVALKTLGPGPVPDSARRAFDAEAEVLASLDHPGIARLYEAGTLQIPAAEGAPAQVRYLAVEHPANAQSLVEHVAARSVGIADRVRLFAEVCDAVQSGHRRGVVFALGPESILIDPEGRPRVLAFGARQALDTGTPVGPDLGEPDPDRLLGAIRYLSPERARGDPGEVDVRSDVYSLGVVLYELLAGVPPYDLSDAPLVRVADEIARRPARPPSQVDPALGGELESILLRALSKNRERRYRDAGEFGADLRRFLAGRPVRARRGPVYNVAALVRDSVSRHPVVGVLAAVTAGLIAGLWPGIPLVFHWTPLGRWFDQAAALAPGPVTDPMSRVRVIAMRPDSDLEALASELSIADVSGDPAKSWTLRPLHGRLLESLAGSGATVVAVDIAFRSPRPGDEALASGVRTLVEAGIPVVVGSASWPMDQGADPPIVPAVLGASARWGGVTVGADPAQHCLLHAIAQRAENEPVPSLALEAFAAQLRPDAEPIYSLDRAAVGLEIRHRARRTGEARGREVGRHHMALSSVMIIPDGPQEDDGLREGDVVGVRTLSIPEDERLESATIPYEQVLRASPEQRREWFSGKAIMIGDLRGPGDVAVYTGGRPIKGVYAQAVALDALLGHGVVRMPTDGQIHVILLATSLVGAAIPWRFRRRAAVAGLVAVAFLLVAASVLAVRLAHYECNPGVPLVSLGVAAVVAGEAARARRTRAARQVQRG